MTGLAATLIISNSLLVFAGDAEVSTYAGSTIADATAGISDWTAYAYVSTTSDCDLQITGKAYDYNGDCYNLSASAGQTTYLSTSRTSGDYQMQKMWASFYISSDDGGTSIYIPYSR